MRLQSVKFLLIIAFSIFLVHDFLPHLHFDEHSEPHRHHMDKDDHHDHEPLLSHNIDHVFVSKKNEQISLFKSISFVIIPIDLSLDEKGMVLLPDKSESLITPPLISSVSLRAPPLA